MKTCPYCENPVTNYSRRCPFCGRNLDLELALKLERERAEAKRRDSLTNKVLLIVLAAVILYLAARWFSVYSPVGSVANQAATQTAVARAYCDPAEVQATARQLIDFNDRWADIMALAVSVEGDALVVQVDRLQRIRRDAKAIAAPPCMLEARYWLITGMDAHIEALLAYMRNHPLDEVNQAITRGNIEMNAFGDEISRLQKCAPNCGSVTR